MATTINHHSPQTPTNPSDPRNPTLTSNLPLIPQFFFDVSISLSFRNVTLAVYSPYLLSPPPPHRLRAIFYCTERIPAPEVETLSGTPNPASPDRRLTPSSAVVGRSAGADTACCK